MLAKWRMAGVEVVILDHPTRGIDVGAKEDVYELIRDMTAEGLAVVLLGDTLEEVIGLSSRILVMRDGEIAATFDAAPGKKPTQVELVGTWCEDDGVARRHCRAYVPLDRAGGAGARRRAL